MGSFSPRKAHFYDWATCFAYNSASTWQSGYSICSIWHESKHWVGFDSGLSRFFHLSTTEVDSDKTSFLIERYWGFSMLQFQSHLMNRLWLWELLSAFKKFVKFSKFHEKKFFHHLKRASFSIFHSFLFYWTLRKLKGKGSFSFRRKETFLTKTRFFTGRCFCSHQ